MSTLIRTPLGYFADTSRWLLALEGAPHRVFLDSAHPHSQRGRYDIICADPIDIINVNTITYESFGEFTFKVNSIIEQALSQFASSDELPFCGGAVGVLSYELGEILSLGRAANCDSTPLFIGIYDWALIIDHHAKSAELVRQPGCRSAYAQQIAAGTAPVPPSSLLPPRPNFALTSSPHASLDQADYRRAFNRLQDYIQAGDCYQVNLTRQFAASCEGDPVHAYLSLRQVAAAPYSVFFDLGTEQLLSLSPERFISVSSQGEIRTEPIKGTARRDPDPMQDQALAKALQQSAKNQAENVMIVDLLRNDLSKSCKPGSITANPLMELQSFNTVHHLVSTVTGQLRPEVTPLTALLDCFPGGSITGAPKRRAMEIIAELEPHRRDLYCGSVFYLSANGRLDSNITIRSFVCRDGEIRTWAGGGIVSDSDADEEFRETQDKIGKLLDSLQARH